MRSPQLPGWTSHPETSMLARQITYRFFQTESGLTLGLRDLGSGMYQLIWNLNSKSGIVLIQLVSLLTLSDLLRSGWIEDFLEPYVRRLVTS